MAQDFDLTAHLPAAGVGVDVGSTLTKIAAVRGGALRFWHAPSAAVEDVLAQVQAAGEGPVALTGAGAARFRARLAAREPVEVSEFAAVAGGVRLFLRRDGLDPGSLRLVANVGTGTSVLRIDASTVERVGGSALGGGTLMGLGRLLCGVETYPELAQLAARGDRGRVDLRVGDVYPDGIEGLMAQATAANFGQVREAAPADIAQGLCGMVGESLGLLCGALARAHGVDEVVFCGAALLDNPALTAVLLGATMFAGAAAQALTDGAYCGAVGALAALACPAAGTA